MHVNDCFLPIDRIRPAETRRLRRALIAVAFAVCASPHVFADYTIQIGAFQEPNRSFVQSAGTLGEVRSARTGDGYLRYTVGTFSSVREAQTLLTSLQSMGYGDAFVRPMSTDSRPLGAATRDNEQANVEVSVAGNSDDMLLRSLSPEERAKVVYLDGVLHIKEGDAFTPLHEYR